MANFLLERISVQGLDCFDSHVNTFLQLFDDYSDYYSIINNELLLENPLRIDELTQKNVNDKIPVGSVNFTNKVLTLQGYNEIPPLNIPQCLWGMKYVSRNIAVVNSKADLYHCCKNWRINEVFIKSSTKLKTEYTGLYKIEEFPIIPNDIYFISEPVNFVSEWRVFIKDHSTIIGMQHYNGDSFIIPSEVFIQQCVNELNSRKICPAYTLDVGVLENRGTAVIEVHPFAACGLYGFESKDIIQMTIDAYKWLRKNKDRKEIRL